MDSGTDTGSTRPDVSIVVNAHREAALAHHTLRSLQEACERARGASVAVEVLLVLDRPDDLTRDYLLEASGPHGYFAHCAQTRLIEVDHGDLGLSRNAGVSLARGDIVGILDADNLVSSDWIVSGVATCRSRPGVVVHPEYVVTFEGRRVLWHAVSSEDERFRPELFYEYNYWDAFSMAARDVYLAHPFVATGPRNGFGPEDWHWNMQTMHAGVAHVLAPGTALFYRVKATGSLMAAHESNRSIAPPTPFLLSTAVATAAADYTPPFDDGHLPLRMRLRDIENPVLRRVMRRFRRARRTGVPDVTHLVPARAEQPRQSPFARLQGFDAVGYRILNPDLDDVPDDELRAHYGTGGRRAGRRASLTPEERHLLDPSRFVPDHYRLLYPDLAGLDDLRLARHYLTYGLAEGRATALRAEQLEQLDVFDPNAYRRHNPDLHYLDDAQLVSHFLVHGMKEGRTSSVSAIQKAMEAGRLPDWLLAEWTAKHRVDTRVPVPTPTVLSQYAIHGHAPHLARHLAADVWWRVVPLFAERRPDVLFLVPWVRMGGGDRVVSSYVTAIRKLRPHAQVAVVTTMGPSTHREWLPDDITFVELSEVPGFQDLPKEHQDRLVADLVVQLGPEVLHVVNSGHGFEIVEKYPTALAQQSRVFLSTFVIEQGPAGELYSWLANRPIGYLDAISAVLVDTSWISDFFWELDRLPRTKFLVHHHPVDIPPRRAIPTTRPDRLNVLWAARFDRQKRLDVLAAVVERVRELGLPVTFHVLGRAVMEDDVEIEALLERLRGAGAVIGPPYASTLSTLPLDEFGMFLMTSEWEGVPITLLDAMASQLPVLVSPVGGVVETVDESTGFTTSSFDAVEEYVEVIAAVAADPSEARARAAAARDKVAATFSWSHFLDELEQTPGYLPGAEDRPGASRAATEQLADDGAGTATRV